MNKKLTTSLIIVAILILCVVFRFFATKSSEKAQQEKITNSMIPKVTLMTPFEVETSSVIEAPGRIVAVESAEVIARVQGMILKQHYKDGDYVKKGQLLYTIDPTEFQIAVDSARANLENAKAKQYQAQKDFERAKELVAKDFVSVSSYDEALATKNAANATVKASKAALDDANRLLSYTKVLAPISGKISSTIITAGNYINSANTTLTKIVSIDPIYVEYSLDSSLYSKLKGDEILPEKNTVSDIKVEVTLPNGSLYEKSGKVYFSDNEISQTTGSIALRAVFPNENFELIPGDFVNVKVYSNKKIARIAVPQASVMQDSDGRYLYVVDSENVAHKRKIETDGQKGDNWIIKSGVSLDDRIVVNGAIGTRDGVGVQILQNNKTEEKNDEAVQGEENQAEQVLDKNETAQNEQQEDAKDNEITEE